MVAMDTSYLEKQVSTIINKLHELFDEIGVPSHDRDSRESELFAALSETLHNQLRLVTKSVYPTRLLSSLTFSSEKHELAEKAENLITTIKQIQISLEGKNANQNFDHDLKVTYPLKPCLKLLSEKHAAVSKVHRERYEHVKSMLPGHYFSE
jgi:Ase1/PRC1/MAP65 family protein